LVACSYFFEPNTPLLDPKIPLFNGRFAFLAICFMVRKGFVYTIVVDIYAFRLAFSGKKYCILHHFSLRLAPKRTAFSTKTQCV